MEVISEIYKKYSSQGHDPEVFLKGLLVSRPLTYWDYIQVDTLLSLQHPRTDYPDEKVFIVYHQAVELFLNLLLHELQQVLEKNNPTDSWCEDKLNRIANYASILNTTFQVMNEGLDYEQYNSFRLALAPASGFQSVQYRLVEIMCAPPEQLLHRKWRETGEVKVDNPVEFYDKLYWREAGINPTTGLVGMMLKAFDERYKELLLETFRRYKGRTLYHWALAHQAQGRLTERQRENLRRLDHIYNVEWPLTHLQTAERYLADHGEVKQSTGASHWREYLHPAHQKRIFFPFLWSEEEVFLWGQQNAGVK